MHTHIPFKINAKSECESVSRPVVSALCDPMDCVAHQALLSMEFFRQEYWSGLSFPPPGDLPNAGIKPRSPASQADSSPLGHRSSPETGGRPLEPHLPSALRLRWSRARALFLSLPCHQALGTASSPPAVLCPSLALRPQRFLFYALFLPQELVPEPDGATVSTKK